MTGRAGCALAIRNRQVSDSACCLGRDCFKLLIPAGTLTFTDDSHRGILHKLVMFETSQLAGDVMA